MQPTETDKHESTANDKAAVKRGSRRVHADSLYRADVTAQRHYFVALVNAKLKIASRIGKARMMWTTTTCYGTPKVTFKYGVALREWPEEEIPFGVMPGNMWSLRILTMLVQRFETGKTYFEELTMDELQAWADREDQSLVAYMSLTSRVDTGRRRLRGEATRSKKLRKYDVKTSRTSYGRED